MSDASTVTAQLEAHYDRIALSGEPGHDFRAYTGGALHGTVPGLPKVSTDDIAALSPPALLTAFRLGRLHFSESASFDKVMARADSTDMRFQLWIAAFRLLHPRDFIVRLRKEDPALYLSFQRDLLAQLELFMDLRGDMAFQTSRLVRWAMSEPLIRLLDQLCDVESLRVDIGQWLRHIHDMTAATGEPLAPFLAPLRLLPTLAEFKEAATHSAAATPELFCGQVQAPLALVVTADPRYWRLYGARFLKSCAGQGVPHVHVHLVNPQLAPSDLMNMSADLALHVSATAEHSDLKGHNLGVYTALSRYRLLPYWLSRFGTVVISDIDGLCILDPIALQGLPVGAAMLHRPKWQGVNHETLLWKNYHAGRAVFRGPVTTAMQAAASFVATAFKDGLVRGDRLWHLDQIALGLLPRAFPKQSILPAPPIFHQTKLKD